ncbi:hypothetical protein GF351_06080 [Candidatus Woesearchaeota archaeon]|nr:hypothetical protein [Candidatus Woesearchaeota archaeon]
MRFAHLADCHVGGWRDPKLREVSIKAFIRAVDDCISQEVDFILISGDLFNTSLPSLDKLKESVKKLKELKDRKIPVYLIAGSHDFSPSGKTMLDVLEHAGLFVNVAKGEDTEDNRLRLRFTVDPSTGAKITGMPGKKGGLERAYFQNLVRDNLEKEQGYKIFMFHSALTEFKPEDMKEMDSHPLSLLPGNFSYYAGGHVHYVFEKDEQGYGKIVFPGPLFPNNFRELEKLRTGGYYLVDIQDGNTKAQYRPVVVHNTESISKKCDHKSPEEVQMEIAEEIKAREFMDTIVTIRLEGTLKSGRPSDIDFKEIFRLLYEKQAYFVMKNTNKLTTEEFEEIKIDTSSTDDVESELIKEHLGQIKVRGMDYEQEEKLIRSLMHILEAEREDGEKVADFEKRIRGEAEKLITL